MKRRGHCCICGGSEFVEATDNHGNRYLGCMRCTIVPVADIARRQREGRERQGKTLHNATTGAKP
jgi:hypothetical protein